MAAAGSEVTGASPGETGEVHPSQNRNESTEGGSLTGNPCMSKDNLGPTDQAGEKLGASLTVGELQT